MTTLESTLTTTIGVRHAKTAEGAIGAVTVGDLVRHLPFRWVERGQLTEIGEFAEGEQVTVVARIQRVELRPLAPRAGSRRRRSILSVEVGDGRNVLSLKFFNQPFRERDLTVGREGIFAGQIKVFNRTVELANPDYELFDETADGPKDQTADEFAGGLIPVYPGEQKMAMGKMRRAISDCLHKLGPLPDSLPAELRARRGLDGYDAALRTIHRPPDWEAAYSARRRMKWDEALTLQLLLAQRRHAAAAFPTTARPVRSGGLLDAFDAQLPFTLTDGQREVGAEIAAEVARTEPMHRLLQGEVGSGKTVVAVRAMLQVVDSGGQAALLAPTEVLAAQHARSIASLLGPLGRAGELGGADAATRVTLLTGSQSAAERRRALAVAAHGTSGIVVGTHALIQETVAFADLGLVVVDEQHRFGVEQRDALRGKADKPPHVLVMTATPIPRTVAMTVFGDLETSSLRELPAGRSPIATTVVPAGKEHWMDRVWSRVREEVEAGHRAYVVCARIGDGGKDEDRPDADGIPAEERDDKRPVQAVIETLPMLADGPLVGLRIAALHGRMPAEEKEIVMRRFGDGDLDVMVATTVIEVGVDVPAATVMVVLDADRFGISQLHQLRGRVGRGRAPGLCLLVTGAADASPARERLEAVAATTDGFELSRADLRIRREGDVLGANQSGARRTLRLLSLQHDEKIIVEARAEASDIIAADPGLTGSPLLAAQVAGYADEEKAGFLEKT